MRITELSITSEMFAGFDNSKMANLGRLVVLSGPNGAGKTRFLEALNDAFHLKSSSREISDEMLMEIPGMRNRFKEILREAALKDDAKSAGQVEKYTRIMSDFYNQNEKFEDLNLVCDEGYKIFKEMRSAFDVGGTRWDAKASSVLLAARQKFRRYRERKNFVLDDDAAPDVLKIELSGKPPQNPLDLARKAPSQFYSDAKTGDIGRINNSAYGILQHIFDVNWAATHPKSSAGGAAKLAAEAEFNKLTGELDRIGGFKLGYSSSGTVQCFGFEIGDAKLSLGQTILLKSAVLLHLRGGSLRKSILLLDEHENHLHPAALADFMRRLLASVDEGQIWVATHSPTIISMADLSSVYWFESGRISKMTKCPEKVISGLIGGEDARLRLVDFLDSPYSIGSNRFVIESLTAPEVVSSAKPDDLQLSQIKKVIRSARSAAGGVLRILDFGAGTGRLPRDLLNDERSVILREIVYHGFEPDHDRCSSLRKFVLDNTNSFSSAKVFDDDMSILSDVGVGYYDVVVMCNVLHEISIDDYGKYFGPRGLLVKLLRPGGCLLVVEVQQLPYGEMANAAGFLVYSEEQIRMLFGCEADVDQIAVESSGEGWLKAFMIPRDCLNKYTRNTLLKSLESLEGVAFEKLKKLRGSNSGSYLDGKIHGFWMTQYANAGIALRMLGD